MRLMALCALLRCRNCGLHCPMPCSALMLPFASETHSKIQGSSKASTSTRRSKESLSPWSYIRKLSYVVLS